MQTVIQVICDGKASLKDDNLEKHCLTVNKTRKVSRKHGWAKLKSTETNVRGVKNIRWFNSTATLEARGITKGDNRPDELIGDFTRYLLESHHDRIRMITIVPE